MKSRTKKARRSHWFQKQFTPKEEVFKAPVFENLEERQLMSNTMLVSTNLSEIVSTASDVDDIRVNPRNGDRYANTVAAGATPFNDVLKHSKFKREPWAGNKFVASASILGGSGAYTLSANGTGTLKVEQASGGNFLGGTKNISFSGSGRTNRRLNIGGGSARLARFTITSGNLSNIKLVKNGVSGTFDNAYTNDLSSFASLRFMDWAQINHNKTSSWRDRTTTNDSQGHEVRRGATVGDSRKAGVALENMIDLANKTNKNPWFTVPTRANPDYIKQMAQTIKNRLRGNLKFFVEYSNETWNSEFSAYHYVNAEGARRSWGSGPAAGNRFVAHQSANIWKIFNDALGNQRSRMIKVMGSKASTAAVGEARLAALASGTYNRHGIKADVLAIAPYFGGVAANKQVNWRALRQSDGKYRQVFNGLKGSFNRLNRWQKASHILTEANRSLESTTSTDSIDWNTGRVVQDTRVSVRQAVRGNKTVANRHNVHLVTYEGGQHIVGNRGAENSEVLTRALVDANRSSTMRTIYNRYLNILAAEGVSLYTQFNHVAKPGKWGSWGMMENQNDTGSQKRNAIVSWINSNRASINILNNFTNHPNTPVTPHPSTGLQTVYQLGRTNSGGVTGSTFQAGEGLHMRRVGNAYETRSKNSNAANNTPRSWALASRHGEYTKFTLTPPRGKRLDLRNADLKVTIKRKSNWLSPKKYTMYARTATGWVFLGTATNTRTDARTYRFRSSNSKLLSNQPIEIRIYSYEGRHANSWNSSGNITNILFKGKVV